MRGAKLEGGVLTSTKPKNFTVKPRPAGSVFDVGANCRACLHILTMGTGSGPEGSRPTIEYCRSWGCGVETSFWITDRKRGCNRKHAHH